MTDTDSLEEILSKFAGNKIDSKEFLNLILTFRALISRQIYPRVIEN